MIDPEIQRYNTPGFSGCLSGVKFNTLVPLKAIFRPTSVVRPYSIRGELVESSCASMLPLTTILIPPEMDPWYMGTGRCRGGGASAGRETPASVSCGRDAPAPDTAAAWSQPPALSPQSSPMCTTMAGLGSSLGVSEAPGQSPPSLPQFCNPPSPPAPHRCLSLQS